MMTLTVKQLKDILSKYNDTDEVFIYADICQDVTVMINNDYVLQE